MSRLSALLQRLQATVPIAEPVAQLRARLLLRIVLFLLLIGSLLTAGTVAFGPAAQRPSLLRGGLLTLALVAVTYLVGRSRFYRLAPGTLMATFTLAILVTIRSRPEDPTTLMYLIVPVALGSLFASVPVTAGVALSGLVIIVAAAPMMTPPPVDTLTRVLPFYLLISSMLLLTARLRDELELQRQAELQRSAARLRTYFDQANDWIFTLDASGRLTSVNATMCAASGFTAGELLGRDPADFVIAADQSDTRQALTRLLHGESIPQLEVPVRLRNGRDIWLEIRGRSFDDNGQIVETLHIARDVTERRAMQEAEREQRRLAESLTAVAGALNSTLDLNQVLDHVLDNLERVVPHDAAEIMLLEGSTARVVRHRGYEQLDAVEAVEQLQLDVNETTTLRLMIESGRPLVVADTREFRGWVWLPGLEWVRSSAGTPIQRQGHILGFLHVASLQPNRHTDQHARQLEAFAAHVSNAIDNARLYEAEYHRRVQAETLREAAAVLSSSLALEEVLQRILEQLMRAIPCDSASVQQRAGSSMILRATRGFAEPARLHNLAFPIREQFPNAVVIQRKEPLALADVKLDYPHFHDNADTYQSGHIRSWLGVPLIVNDEVIGMVTLDRQTVSPYSAEECSLAVTFAAQAAIAMHNAGLYEQLARYNETLETAVHRRTNELQRTTRQIAAIMHNSTDAICLIDSQERITTWNPAFERLFARQPAAHMDEVVERLVTESGQRQFRQALEYVRHNRVPTRLEFEAHASTGGTFEADMAVFPVPSDAEATTLVCSIRDISERKEIERLKDAFVSNVSHELRTPIASLKLHHDLIRLNPAKQPVYMDRMEREIARLTVIVEALLRLSRLDQGHVEWRLAPLELNELAAQYVADRLALAGARQLELAAELAAELPRVMADPNMLGQVIDVLLTNAFTYTPAGGRVRLRTWQARRHDAPWVGLSVSDSGPGVPAAERLKIFERFYRGSSGQNSGAPGTGLGLAIAMEIVRHHGGRLLLETDAPDGRGATFTVWLPALAGDASGPA